VRVPFKPFGYCRLFKTYRYRVISWGTEDDTSCQRMTRLSRSPRATPCWSCPRVGVSVSVMKGGNELRSATTYRLFLLTKLAEGILSGSRTLSFIPKRYFLVQSLADGRSSRRFCQVSPGRQSRGRGSRHAKKAGGARKIWEARRSKTPGSRQTRRREGIGTRTDACKQERFGKTPAEASDSHGVAMAVEER
jgi:hypothetical protein